MSDIFASVPWRCEDKACPARWHCRNYWIYDDGKYSVDDYGNGDHESCSAEDVPSWEEIDAAERQYVAWVFSEVEDPLHWFNVRSTYSVPRTYVARVCNTLLGPALQSVTCDGTRLTLSKLSQPVRDYLALAEKVVLPDTELLGLSWAELCKSSEVTLEDSVAIVTFVLEHEIVRDKRSQQEELRSSALHWLQRREQWTADRASRRGATDAGQEIDGDEE